MGDWEYPQETFPGDVPRGRGDNVRIIFGMPAAKNLGRPRKCQNFGVISDNFRLWSRMSPERRATYQTFDQRQPLPRRAKIFWWTLVHKPKSARGAYWPTLSALSLTQFHSPRDSKIRPLLREEFRLPKLTLHSDLRRRAASGLTSGSAHTSSFYLYRGPCAWPPSGWKNLY